jgi:dTDP-4-amino-4,6-dideoxygalactose transaminase
MAEILRLIRTHGEKAKYNSVILGYNYRMSEIQAAIGLVQLRKLPVFLSKRRKNANTLTTLLSKSNKIKLPFETENRQHSWYLYTIRLQNSTERERDKIVAALRKKDIGAEVYYRTPVHLMTYYHRSYGRRQLPETEKAAKQVISLPIHPSVTEKQVEYIGKTFLELF